MSAYYNEIDPYCAQWLRNLIAAGLIPAGDVDERPIEEVTGDDVRPYTQCHFFAGIGGWAYAARLAGWPDDRPIWTGSCPCQPFSNAGKRLAYDDPRNLWPDFARLIADCCPAVVAGEQVASKAGRLWLAGIRADLEALGYGVGAADLCAAGVGAPHIRQRLWWVADTYGQCEGSLTGVREGQGAERAGARFDRWVADDDGERRGEQRSSGILDSERSASGHDTDGRGAVRGLGHAGSAGSGRDTRAVPRAQAQSGSERQAARREPDEPVAAGADGGLGDPVREGRARDTQRLVGTGGTSDREVREAPWDNAIWIPCADGKARRIEPGIEPLVDGVPARVGKLRAYGNAIVPQVAAEVLTAYIERQEATP